MLAAFGNCVNCVRVASLQLVVTICPGPCWPEIDTGGVGLAPSPTLIAEMEIMEQCAPRRAWWQEESALHRVVADLVAAELAQARPGRARPASPWSAGLDLARDLGADSLDLTGAATALADLFQFGRSGTGDALLGRPVLSDWIDAARAGLSAFDAELVFRTSGSSGMPKRCAHRLGDLWREVDELARLLPGRRRVLAAVPAHHIYGFLFTVLLPQALAQPSNENVPVHELRTASPAALGALLRPGDLVVAHPDLWRQVAALGLAFPADVVGVSSTAPCPDEVARALAEGGLRLVQVYGSSETAGVGWREAAGEPYRLFPYWRRAGEGALERAGRDGASERFPLQDRVAWSDPRCFLPAGRIDQAVQVGGTNVFPAYVAEVLGMHPAVFACRVRLMRPDEGTRLKAFVVPRAAEDTAALRADLPGWIAARLTPPECPVAFSFGPALPRGPGGKPTDWIIDAWE